MTDAFNTIDGGIVCPFCDSDIMSGVGFKLGHLANLRYKVGDELKWEGGNCRPASCPDANVIKTIGYFNCDNIKCSSWQDCYPNVQLALITIENNTIAGVEPYRGELPSREFAILEPAELNK